MFGGTKSLLNYTMWSLILLDLHTRGIASEGIPFLVL